LEWQEKVKTKIMLDRPTGVGYKNKTRLYCVRAWVGKTPSLFGGLQIIKQMVVGAAIPGVSKEYPREGKGGARGRDDEPVSMQFRFSNGSARKIFQEGENG
jgi:hypothetical protein